ncbi:MAG TPA: GNAT family N-acetyltransferase [Roseiflexaceae bacterium]|nr:GNAT family N-acetyltransferase [Roseiflexaceae bacterium]
MTGPHLRSPGAGVAGLIQENMVAYFRLFAGLPGITVVDDDVFWLVSARGEPGNYVLRARLAGDTERRIDEVLGQVGRHTDRVDWMVFPGCRPADLGARLAARGMQGGPGGIWMLANLPAHPGSPAAPEGFRVEPVRTLAQLDAWRRVSAAGFGADVQIHAEAYARHGFGPAANSLHFTGYLRGEPVTSGTLLLAGGIAGIWDVSTPPPFRGQGFGGALTLALLREAHARGYRRAWVWSSHMGRRVYERASFVAVDAGVREYPWHRRDV